MSAQVTAACKPDPRTHRWHSQDCGYLSGHGDERSGPTDIWCITGVPGKGWF